MIHPTAMVDPSARLSSGVVVGPGCMIGPDVEIGENTSIGAYAVIQGPTRIGRDNKIFQFNSLGDVPQDKKYRGERSFLEIGERNVIREYCTFNRGTAQGGGVTRIGNDNWIMAYVHIAHDCQIGNHTVMANGTTMAGHVVVGDHATFGAFTMVHQFCSLGTHSFTAMGTVVFKDVLPFVTVAGNTARPRGLNTEGLRRRGYTPETILTLRRAYKLIYKQGRTVDQAIAELEELASECPEVELMVSALRHSGRGIVR